MRIETILTPTLMRDNLIEIHKSSKVMAITMIKEEGQGPTDKVHRAVNIKLISQIGKNRNKTRGPIWDSPRISFTIVYKMKN